MSAQSPRNPVIAGVLSIVPGLGQMYAGEWQRGIVLFLGLPAQAAVLCGAGMPWLAAATGLVWVWNIRDAACAARGGKCSASTAVVLLLALNVAAAWKVT
ncbi:MAG: hypothetical protein ACP5R5_10270, partial [Armatimonadota bacterium]